MPIRANRFIAFVVPLLFVLFNATLNEAARGLAGPKRTGTEDDPAGRFVLAAATAVALLIVNGLWLPSPRANDFAQVKRRAPARERTTGALTDRRR